MCHFVLYRLSRMYSGMETEGVRIGTHNMTAAVGSESPELERPHHPPVTVLMPVYNGETYIGEAVDSILNQTHRDFEFLIINDGSTDGTAGVLDELAARDARIRVVHQENRDQPATLNRGLSLARHDWVAIIDHDDVCMPDRLEKQLRVIAENESVRVVGTYAYEISGDGKFIGSVPLGPTTVPEFRALRAANEWVTLVHSSVMLHRPTIVALGGYREEFGSAADSDLWSRVADEHDVIALPEYLVLYRIHVNSMSCKRFFEQQFVVRWIRACQDARRNGLPEPSMQDQQGWERGQFGLRRLRILRYDWMMNLLRRRRLARFQGHRVYATMLFMAAMTLDPGRAIRKVMRRVTRSQQPLPSASRPPGWMRSSTNRHVVSRIDISTQPESIAVGSMVLHASGSAADARSD